MWVDINYSVTGTPLGELCAEHGLAFADGKEMLFFQGLRSFEIWNNLFFTNREKEALLETFLRKSKRNIVLVGFMGSGKSTLSVQLEQMAGFKCHSTDLMLESKLGKSISRIFSEEGERFFRDEEQRILSLALGAGGPCVIDTGGGAVERDENRFAIQASGAFVVWLDADSEKLLERLKGSTSRPLLAGRTEEEVIALIERRRPLYRDVAHIRLDATDDPLYLAKEIMKQWSEF